MSTMKQQNSCWINLNKLPTNILSACLWWLTQTDVALTYYKTLLELEIGLLMGWDIEWGGADFAEPVPAAAAGAVLGEAGRKADCDDSSIESGGDGTAATAAAAGPARGARPADDVCSPANPADPAAYAASAAPAGGGRAGGAGPLGPRNPGITHIT